MPSPSTPQGYGQFPPPNIPGVNLAAPVIRIGGQPGAPSTVKPASTDPHAARRAAGLGYNSLPKRGDPIVPLQPPTREEIARTIFIGNITDGCSGDAGMQRILNAGGGLRRWTRCLDAHGKGCSFGFAEYEDADSLRVASEILQDLQVPKYKAEPNVPPKNEQTTKLLVIIDENSQRYIDEWRSKGQLASSAEGQFRADGAREELQQVIAGLKHGTLEFFEGEGDMLMPDGETRIDSSTGEVVYVPMNVDDELADIPANMREMVAREIAHFRERSAKRDLERLKKEEEMEAAQRAKAMAQLNRASPPPKVAGAPAGPKALGSREKQNGVSFSGLPNGSGYTKEEEESDASDGEIARRREAKKNAELEKAYLDQERRWLNRERSRTAALEREKQREREEAAKLERERDAMARRLKEFDDDVEAGRRTEEYYRDRSAWIRKRATVRAREIELDDRDRAAEEAEQAKEEERRTHDLSLADQFLAQQAQELAGHIPAREPTKFKMSLGAAAQRAHAAAPARRTMADVEGLLEDEEDEDVTTTKRTLRPITELPSISEGATMTEEERADAARQLAKDIPADKDGLWAWPIKWAYVDNSVVSEQLRPFVERKIMEYLGVQEQMLVDLVEDAIRKRMAPADLVSELEGALEEEAEVLVKKLWRMLIFFSESEKRGLSA